MKISKVRKLIEALAVELEGWEGSGITKDDMKGYTTAQFDSKTKAIFEAIRKVQNLADDLYKFDALHALAAKASPVQKKLIEKIYTDLEELGQNLTEAENSMSQARYTFHFQLFPEK